MIGGKEIAVADIVCRPARLRVLMADIVCRPGGMRVLVAEG
jgi:hypothetical protein